MVVAFSPRHSSTSAIANLFFFSKTTVRCATFRKNFVPIGDRQRQHPIVPKQPVQLYLILCFPNQNMFIIKACVLLNLLEDIHEGNHHFVVLEEANPEVHPIAEVNAEVFLVLPNAEVSQELLNEGFLSAELFLVPLNEELYLLVLNEGSHAHL